MFTPRSRAPLGPARQDGTGQAPPVLGSHAHAQHTGGSESPPADKPLSLKMLASLEGSIRTAASHLDAFLAYSVQLQAQHARDADELCGDVFLPIASHVPAAEPSRGGRSGPGGPGHFTATGPIRVASASPTRASRRPNGPGGVSGMRW